MMTPEAVMIVAACEFSVLVVLAESAVHSKKLTLRRRMGLYTALAAVSLASVVAAVLTFRH